MFTLFYFLSLYSNVKLFLKASVSHVAAFFNCMFKYPKIFVFLDYSPFLLFISSVYFANITTFRSLPCYLRRFTSYFFSFFTAISEQHGRVSVHFQISSFSFSVLFHSLCHSAAYLFITEPLESRLKTSEHLGKLMVFWGVVSRPLPLPPRHQ